MAFQRVPETAEIAVNYTVAGIHQIQNTFAARFVGGYSQADLETLAGIVDNSVALNFLPLLSPNVLYRETEVRGLDSENDLVVIDNTSSASGSGTGDVTSNNVSLAIKKASGLTGRSARGRIFWPPIQEDKLQTDDNFVTQAHVDAIVAAVDQLRADIGASGWVPVIISRFSNGVQRTNSMGELEAVTFTWTFTEAVDTRVDSQRGRLP